MRYTVDTAGKKRVTVIAGDGIGPEVVAATRRIIDATGVKIGSEEHRVREHRALKMPEMPAAPDFVHANSRRTMGADLFVESPLSSAELGESLDAIVDGSPLRLEMISNRGTRVYVDNGAMPDCVDEWRCRFVLRDAAGDLDDATLMAHVANVAKKHRWMHLEKLQELDGKAAYSLAQGED